MKISLENSFRSSLWCKHNQTLGWTCTYHKLKSLRSTTTGRDVFCHANVVSKGTTLVYWAKIPWMTFWVQGVLSKVAFWKKTLVSTPSLPVSFVYVFQILLLEYFFLQLYTVTFSAIFLFLWAFGLSVTSMFWGFKVTNLCSFVWLRRVLIKIQTEIIRAGTLISRVCSKKHHLRYN